MVNIVTNPQSACSSVIIKDYDLGLFWSMCTKYLVHLKRVSQLAMPRDTSLG